MSETVFPEWMLTLEATWLVEIQATEFWRSADVLWDALEERGGYPTKGLVPGWARPRMGLSPFLDAEARLRLLRWIYAVAQYVALRETPGSELRALALTVCRAPDAPLHRPILLPENLEPRTIWKTIDLVYLMEPMYSFQYSPRDIPLGSYEEAGDWAGTDPLRREALRLFPLSTSVHDPELTCQYYSRWASPWMLRPTGSKELPPVLEAAIQAARDTQKVQLEPFSRIDILSEISSKYARMQIHRRAAGGVSAEDPATLWQQAFALRAALGVLAHPHELLGPRGRSRI